MMTNHAIMSPYGGEVGMEIGGSSEDYELQPDGTSTKRKLSASPALPSSALRAAAAYLAVAKAKRQKLTADRNGSANKKGKAKRKVPSPPILNAPQLPTVRTGAHHFVPTNVDQLIENAKRNDAGPMPPLLGPPPIPDYTSYSDSPYNTTLPGFDTSPNEIPKLSESPVPSVSPFASSSEVVYNPTFILPPFFYPDNHSGDFPLFSANRPRIPNLSAAIIAHSKAHNASSLPNDDRSTTDVRAVLKARAEPIPAPIPAPLPAPPIPAPKAVPTSYKSTSSSPLSSSSSGQEDNYQSADAPLDQIFQFRESMFSLVPGTWVCGFCDRSVDPHANLYTYRPALEKNHGFTAVGNEDVGAHLKSCDAVGEDKTRLLKEWRVGVKARKVQQLRYIAEVTNAAAGADETRRGALTGKVGSAAQLIAPVEEKVVEVVKVKKMAKGWKAAALASNEPVVKKPGRPQSKAIAKREAAAKALEMENGGEGEGASAGAARLAAKRKAAAAASGTVKKIIVAGKLKAAKKPKSHSSSSDAGLSTPNFDGDSFSTRLVLYGTDIVVLAVVIKSEWTSFLSVVHRTTAAAPTSLMRPLLVTRSTDIHSSTTLHRFRLPTMQSRPVDGLLTVNVQFFDSNQRPTTAIEQNVLLALGDGQLRLEVIDEKLHWSVRRGKVRLIDPEEMEA